MSTFTFKGTTFHLATGGLLSEKEQIEAVAVICGLTTKESAKLRQVSPETVKCQRASAKSKVGARSQVEFIMVCIARGWLTTDALPLFLERMLADPKARYLGPCIEFEGRRFCADDIRYIEAPRPRRRADRLAKLWVQSERQEAATAA